MRGLDAKVLLSAWERGRNRHPLDRALLLYAIAAPDNDQDALADQPLGQRNAALLHLCEAALGDAMGACVDCPDCGERLEFTLSAAALRAKPAAITSHVELDGLRFRLPTTRDLACIAHEHDENAATEKLLLSLMEAKPDGRTGTDLAVRLAGALEDADPCADFALDLDCPACMHAWTASFDVARFLWAEFDARARRLLDEVHVLAGAYGWPESEILGLTQARRTAYLERVMA